MSVPPFALPAPDAPDRAPGARAPADAPPSTPLERVRSVAAVGALGAAAVAATLAFAVAVAVFELDVIEVIARPGVVPHDITIRDLRDLASLPGPSLLAIGGLLPATGLLLAAGLLRAVGDGAPRVPGASVEALAAAERTMSWATRAVVAGAIVVFLVPALLQLLGIRVLALTSGSMAPGLPAGSLVLTVAPGDPASLAAGEVVVARRSDGALLTHRIVAVEGAGSDAVAYRTRGDAVAVPDRETVRPSAVEGLVVAGVPILGALRAWMTSPLGIAIGLVLAWSFHLLGGLLGDDRRRVERARSRA